MAVVASTFLTTAEVAAMFRVSDATIGRWVRDGVLPAVRPPGSRGYRFRQDDVDCLIEASQGDTAPVEAVS